MTTAEDGRNPGYGVIAILVLGLLVPLLVIDWQFTAGGFNAVLSLVVLELSAARLSLLIARGEPRMIWLGAHLFIYPFLGVAALAQTTAMHFPLQGVSYAPERITQALFTVLLGVLAMEAGFLIGRKPISARSEEGSTWSYSQARVLLLAFAGLSFVTYAVATTGIAPFFASRDEAAAALAGTGQPGQIYELENKSGFLLTNIATRIPVLLTMLAILVSVRQRTWRYGPLGRPATTLLLLLLAAANLVVNNPIGNSRFWFGVVLLGFLGVFVPWRRPGGFRVLTWSALTTFLMAFPLLDYFRRAESSLGAYSPRTNYLTDVSYSGFQSIINGDLYLAVADHAEGRQLLTSILAFVPRSVWPGKGVDTGQLIDPLYNRSATLWTELQVDFTRVGVVAGFLLLGILVARLENYLGRQDLAAALLLPLLAGVMVYALRGSLLPVMGTLYPLVILYRLMLHRERRSTALNSQRPTHGTRAITNPTSS